MKKALTILSAAVVLLATGCSKSPFSHKGETITFGTVTEGAQTRAAYGTDVTLENNKIRQRIDW